MSEVLSQSEMQPEVGHARWEQIESLGRGEYGLVFKVKNTSDIGTLQPVYAAKISTGRGYSNELLLKEIDVHSRLVHPNIIQYITSFEMLECGGKSIIQVAPGTVDMACVCMIIEIANGNLQQQFRPRDPDNQAVPIDIRFVKKWARDLVSALIYLKEQSIIHRDIKLQNVLVSGGAAKLADFGFAIKIEDLPPLDVRKVVGTPVYFAPEVIKSKLYSYQSDLWALGVVIYSMLMGRLPFVSNKMNILADKILKGVKWPLPREHESIDAFFTQSAFSRIKIEAVLSLPFFTGEVQQKPGMQLNVFKMLKEEFGSGTREAFYMYLANRFPESPPLSLKDFNELYDQLYL